jgi:hypothetical protein
MQVQFLAGGKKDRSGKVARLKEFELPATRLKRQNEKQIIQGLSKRRGPRKYSITFVISSSDDE